MSNPDFVPAESISPPLGVSRSDCVPSGNGRIDDQALTGIVGSSAHIRALLSLIIANPGILMMELRSRSGVPSYQLPTALGVLTQAGIVQIMHEGPAKHHSVPADLRAHLEPLLASCEGTVQFAPSKVFRDRSQALAASNDRVAEMNHAELTTLLKMKNSRVDRFVRSLLDAGGSLRIEHRDRKDFSSALVEAGLIVVYEKDGTTFAELTEAGSAAVRAFYECFRLPSTRDQDERSSAAIEQFGGMEERVIHLMFAVLSDPRKERLMATLADANEPMRVNAISRELDLSRQAIQSTFGLWEAAGIISRPGRTVILDERWRQMYWAFLREFSESRRRGRSATSSDLGIAE